MLSLNKLACDIAQSEIRVMTVECDKVRGVNLAQGICDTPVPSVVRRAAEEAMDRGLNIYVRLDGIAPLRSAIAQKMKSYNGLSVDADKQVIVTNGSTGAFYTACMALLEPGDEVILFEPYYGYHYHTLATMQAVPRFIRLESPEWSFSQDDLARAITPRTKAIVVNSPANPSGKVFSREELGWIADLAMKHDLFVFTDEIYEYFLYDGAEHISPATMPGMFERTLTFSGFSKTFSITGWRVGYAVGSERWLPAMAYYHDLVYICAPAPFQHGATAGLNELGQDFYDGLGRDYRKKRDLLCDALRESGFSFRAPRGSYYVLADASNLPGKDSKAKAMYLLEKTGVAAVPGDAFYHDDAGRNLLRFCYAKTDGDLVEACNRLMKLKATVSVG